MKRKIGVALVLAVVMVLSLSAPALAWEEEGHWDTWEEEGHSECWDEESHQEPDTLIRDNDNFFRAVGFDLVDGVLDDVEGHNGGERGSLADGYDVYQDDGSGEGWLERVQAWGTGYWAQYDGTDLSPLNNRTTHQLESLLYFDTEAGTYKVVDKEAGCIWIVDRESGRVWVPAPVVVDLRPRNKTEYLSIRLPGARLKVERKGTFRADGYVDFNDGVWRIQIPAGVRIWSDNGGAAFKLTVDENGNIMPGVWFMRGEPVVTRM